ncbi:MAG: hypothetical protein ACXWUN_07425 [Allosphingosinicella sp.]
MTLINARLSYADERGWTVALFATNLLDETYIVSGAADPVSFGAAEVNVGQPRRWGVSRVRLDNPCECGAWRNIVDKECRRLREGMPR